MPDGAELQALPVDNPRLAEYYRQVESFQSERARRSQRSSRLAWSIAAAALCANLALGWSVAAMLPLERLVPLYLWVRADGTVDSAVAMSDLPATQSAAVIRAAVWQYVRAREGYSYSTARYHYDLVSLMSAPSVRDIYQHGFLANLNPKSPQNTVGKKGQIDVSMISISFVRPQVALVRYRRSVQMYGEQPTSTTYTATVGFEEVDRLPAVVTSYQNSEDSPQ